MERFRSKSGRSLRTSAMAILWKERRGEEEKRIGEEERPGRTGTGGRAPASLAPYCVEWAPMSLAPVTP
jgi:hypothetical protein